MVVTCLYDGVSQRHSLDIEREGIKSSSSMRSQKNEERKAWSEAYTFPAAILLQAAPPPPLFLPLSVCLGLSFAVCL